MRRAGLSSRGPFLTAFCLPKVERQLPAKIGRCNKNLYVAIFTLEQNHPEKFFLYFSNILSRWFCSKVKIMTAQLGRRASLPLFAIHILNRLYMRIHQAPPFTYHPYLSKNLSKSRLSKSFLGFLGDFWGGEPYLYSEFSYFQNLSVFSNISAWNRIVCNRER